MANIHPTAVVEPGARIADDAVVGALSYVSADATIGPGCHLVSHVAILGRTTLGTGNRVWPHATLGAAPQDLKFHGEQTELIIGDHNEIRESVTIHSGTENGGGVTRLGSENLIMVSAHIAHDCIIGDHVIVTNLVQLAGHIHLGDHAVIGGASAVHSFVSIGPYAFVGGMTRITKDVPPFMTVEGNPATVRGVNTIGLERNRFAAEDIQRLKDAFRRLYRGSNGESSTGNIAENLAALETEHGDDECIRMLIDAVQRSTLGLFGRYRESMRHDNRRRNPAK
jgi:UDP-N-acetylglucosamine acyltransferase